MDCTEKTSITDRERLTAFCNRLVGKCYSERLEQLVKKYWLGGKEPTQEQSQKWFESIKTIKVRLVVHKIIKSNQIIFILGLCLSICA
jgi:hypothetical protein